MQRSGLTWALGAGAAALVIAAMSWVSLTLLRLDTEAAAARRSAAFEEDVRLALWRLDSALAPIISRESSRPIAAYRAFSPIEGALDPLTGAPGRLLLPSPLLLSTPRNVLLHFERRNTGSMRSPQLPTGQELRLAEQSYGVDADLSERRERLAELEAQVDWQATLEALPVGMVQAVPVALPQRQMPLAKRRAEEIQQKLNVAEYQARAQSLQLNLDQVAETKQKGEAAAPKSVALDQGSPVQGLWSGGRLLLVRRAVGEAGDLVQGCWLDWDGLSAELLAGIADILPDARLEPVTGSAATEPPGRRLVSLPLRLEPGPMPREPTDELSPIQLSLAFAWAGLLLATGALVLLLVGSVRLAERRAAFVSAVTHELRTPLTSLRIYAEMLTDGMVQGEEQRRSYLETIETQSERLAHLVENVLAYSRLERGRTRVQVEEVTVDELLGRLERPLAALATQAGMTLSLGVAPSAAQLTLRTDRSAVERILVNLVDNAAKYGRSDHDPGILVTADASDGSLRLEVRDFGPGLSAEARTRLFRPFSKSAVEAAESAPGIGLGLALSHRLAREIGAQLRLEASVTNGTAWVLRVPAGVGTRDCLEAP